MYVYIYIYENVYMCVYIKRGPKSMQHNGPKPLERGQMTSILHGFAASGGSYSSYDAVCHSVTVCIHMNFKPGHVRAMEGV